MSDEPRRSVRATKGQHTKSLDLLDQPAEPMKKRGGKKGAGKKAASQEASAAEDGEDIIRCICGATTQSDDADEMWIACTNCDAWQHNVCMGVSTDQDVLKDIEYYCEQCKREDHQEYWAAVERGEKIWETRNQKYEQEVAAAQKNKKGKKRKVNRGSEIRTTPPTQNITKQPQNTKAESPEQAAETGSKRKQVVNRSGSTKRKTRDGSHDEELSSSKVRKVSPQQATPAPPSEEVPAGLPKTIDELEPARKGSAKLIHKSFVVALNRARDNANYQASDADLESKAVALSLQLEGAVHDSAISRATYNSQIKKLFPNLKTNQELCDRLLDNSLTIKELATMTEEDMASKERQQKDAEMRARAEKQSIMVTEDEGPRIRRTHKGDEVIEDEFVSPTEEMPASRRRSMLDPNHGMGARSRENTPGSENAEGVELPMDIDDYKSHDDIRGNAQKSSDPLSVNTRNPPPLQRKGSSAVDNFDINSVYSKVQSPTVAQHARKPSMPVPPPQNVVQDADVDRLLDDGIDAQSPPYEPPEFEEDPSVLWRGEVVMSSIASLTVAARHVAGGEVRNAGVPWTDILDNRLIVGGRMDTGKANEYLCSLRYCRNIDLCVATLSPVGGVIAEQEFKQLYDYLLGRNRYGVLNNKTTGNVRDTYLIPVPPGTDEGPEFLYNLDPNNFPTPRSEPMMLLAVVIHDAGEKATVEDEMTTPLAMPAVPPPQPRLSVGGTQQAAMSPHGSNTPSGVLVTQSASAASALQTVSASGVNSATPGLTIIGLTPEQKVEAQLRGEAVADEILGEFKNVETAQHIRAQAWRMTTNEWRVIKQVYEENETSRNDLKTLGAILESKAEADAKKDAAVAAEN